MKPGSALSPTLIIKYGTASFCLSPGTRNGFKGNGRKQEEGKGKGTRCLFSSSEPRHTAIAVECYADVAVSLTSQKPGRYSSPSPGTSCYQSDDTDTIDSPQSLAAEGCVSPPAGHIIIAPVIHKAVVTCEAK